MQKGGHPVVKSVCQWVGDACKWTGYGGCNSRKHGFLILFGWSAGLVAAADRNNSSS